MNDWEGYFKRAMSKLKAVPKRTIFIWFFFTLVLSIIVTMGCQISFVDSVWGRPEENYIRPFELKTILNFILAFLCLNAIGGVCVAINRNSRIGEVQQQGSSSFQSVEVKKLWLVSFFVLVVAWFPYYLTYFPGGVYSDTFNNISQAYAMDELGLFALNNHHPILYTLLWRAAILISRCLGREINGAILIFLTGQYVLMAMVMAYLVGWLSVHGLRKSVTYGVLAFIALFPLFPLYAISLWKDTVFCMFLLLFLLNVGEYALQRENKSLLNSPRYSDKTIVFGLLVCFLRNNGKYIVYLTLLVIVLLNIKDLRSIPKYLLTTVAIILAVELIQGPLYNKMGYNVDTAVESLGVPLQQIAYLVYYDYDLTADEMAYINQICPLDQIKEHYNPCLFDAIKWYASNFNISVVSNDFSTFFKFYLKLLINQPIGCIKGYMLATAGFWAPNIASMDAYIQNGVWANAIGIVQWNVSEKLFGVSMQNLVSQMKPISSAVFLFAAFYAAFIVILNREYKKLLMLLPGIANWLTLMLATPIACSLRYVYILVLMLPVDLFLICTSKPVSILPTASTS